MQKNETHNTPHTTHKPTNKKIAKKNTNLQQINIKIAKNETHNTPHTNQQQITKIRRKVSEKTIVIFFALSPIRSVVHFLFDELSLPSFIQHYVHIFRYFCIAKTERQSIERSLRKNERNFPRKRGVETRTHRSR